MTTASRAISPSTQGIETAGRFPPTAGVWSGFARSPLAAELPRETVVAVCK